MSFGARPPFPGLGGYGFNPAPAIYFNPMIGRGPAFPQQIHVNTPPIQPQKVAPTTTVFVGNITERCSNDFMQKMLEECGKVASWKRIQGVGGKYQAFGFCDFQEPEGTLRALRILNEFQVGEKKLVVKAEDKVRADLRTWAIAKRKEDGKPELRLKDHELPADEDDKNKDEEIRLKILNWIEQDHPELLTVAEDGELSDNGKKTKRKEDKRTDRKNRRKRSRSSSRSRKERNRRRSRSPKRKRKRSYSSSSASRNSSGTFSSTSSRSRSRSSTPKHTKKRRSVSRESDSDAEEKRVLKRNLRMKEKAYQERLAKWEMREKDKSKYYDKIERREKDKKLLIIKESKKLKSFLEDYNDEVDDAKYFRYSELFSRRRDFEKEKQQDAKDKLAEQQEIDIIKKELTEQGKYKTPEDIERVAREKHRRQEEAVLRKMRGDSGSPNPHEKLGRSNGAGGYDSSSSSAESEDEKKSQSVSPNSASLGFITTTVEPANWTTTTNEEAVSTPPVKEINGGAAPAALKSTTVLKLDSAKPAKLNTVFAQDEEDDVDLLRTRKQLKPFEITIEERMENITDLEKQKMVKDIINKIPQQKEDLFRYSIPWEVVNDDFINARVRPWVSKKVAEYLGTIGEEEKSLCDFICEKVKDRVEAITIIRDVKQILDDDAEMFVVKLWRLIIFESASKKLGLKSENYKKK